MKKEFKLLIANTKLPYGIEGDNLLWIGGSAEKPWIVTTHSEFIERIDLNGGKSAKQAYLYRAIKGMVELPDALYKMLQQAISEGLEINNQYAFTTYAYEYFLSPVTEQLNEVVDVTKFDNQNPSTFTAAQMSATALIEPLDFPSDLKEAILIAQTWKGGKESIARSTSPSEDGKKFSGSGKYTSRPDLVTEDDILSGIKDCIKSRFNAAALKYQFDAPEEFGTNLVSLPFAVMVQDMDERIDVGGTVFTADTQSNNSDFVRLTMSYGIAEVIVGSMVKSDTWLVAKKQVQQGKNGIILRRRGTKEQRMVKGKLQPTTEKEQKTLCLTDAWVMRVTSVCLAVHEICKYRFGSVQSDEEISINFERGVIQVNQEREITTLSRKPIHNDFVLWGQRIQDDPSGEHAKALTEAVFYSSGLSAGSRLIVHGALNKQYGGVVADQVSFDKAFEATDKAIQEKYGPHVRSVLNTKMTYPYMEATMDKTNATIADEGGVDDHTGITCKEKKKAAIVSFNHSHLFEDMELVTVIANQSEGTVYKGLMPFTHTKTYLNGLQASPVPIRQIMSQPMEALIQYSENYFPDLNIGMGSGLIRNEAVAARKLIHEMVIHRWDSLQEDCVSKLGEEAGMKLYHEILEKTAELSADYTSVREWYIDAMATDIAGILAPYDTDTTTESMTFRLPDFKTNEYRGLLGGVLYEPHEENPMIGMRGAARLLSPEFGSCFTDITLSILQRVIDKGFTNFKIEVPFVRTPDEMKAVRKIIEDRNWNIAIDMMFELPCNFEFAHEFFPYVDGIEIGGNDLLQLLFGTDRSGTGQNDYMRRKVVEMVAKLCNMRDEYFESSQRRIKVEFCGNLPSQHPGFAPLLVEAGLDGFSVTPDAVIDALLAVTGQNPEGNQEVFDHLADGTIKLVKERVSEEV